MFTLAKHLFCLSLWISVANYADPGASKVYSIFIPPPSWEMIDAKALSPKVVAGFVKKGKAGFCPSMNLSVEKVDLPLHKYIEEVKKLMK